MVTLYISNCHISSLNLPLSKIIQIDIFCSKTWKFQKYVSFYYQDFVHYPEQEKKLAQQKKEEEERLRKEEAEKKAKEAEEKRKRLEASQQHFFALMAVPVLSCINLGNPPN